MCDIVNYNDVLKNKCDHKLEYLYSEIPDDYKRKIIANFFNNDDTLIEIINDSNCDFSAFIPNSIINELDDKLVVNALNTPINDPIDEIKGVIINNGEHIEPKNKKKKKRNKKKNDDPIHDIKGVIINNGEHIEPKNKKKKKRNKNKDDDIIDKFIKENENQKKKIKLTDDIVEEQLNTKNNLRGLIIFFAQERKMLHKYEHENRMLWVSLCDAIFKKYNSVIKIVSNGPNFNSYEYYTSLLKKCMADNVINCISYDCNYLFEKYDPQQFPLVLIITQREITDCIPSVQIVVPLSALIRAGIVNENVRKFHPINGKFVCYAMFWSFYTKFNMFGGFYRYKKGTYDNYWIMYDRFEVDKMMSGTYIIMSQHVSERHEP